uniref:Uncharacterized protein n=1 Tax=Chromera velia CCMP2878 TaxID=1169474 RepID=A0A0G4FRD2_9ALVE|eukprot:Cvel_3652.t1-p1 / transcript=Cvel_3652.t1 / gene=Cvel_3652 / organism=Chromera_velia_CCMP2878 / gene_product=hypothetical protein / transcript_product=hypothetical protein / location=Cvel_scaffold151:36927-42074(-) / protein_length=181 / sequence_SO=supercontig / SO=protein_coding / is_pseudo=false
MITSYFYANTVSSNELPGASATVSASLTGHGARFPGGGVYRVHEGLAHAWFMVPLGISLRELCRLAQLVYEEGARMRKVLEEKVDNVGGEMQGPASGWTVGYEVLYVLLLPPGVSERACQGDRWTSRSNYPWDGGGSGEQDAPNTLVTGVCLQNVPKDTSTPHRDLRWASLGFFCLKEIAV